MSLAPRPDVGKTGADARPGAIHLLESHGKVATIGARNKIVAEEVVRVSDLRTAASHGILQGLGSIDVFAFEYFKLKFMKQLEMNTEHVE